MWWQRRTAIFLSARLIEVARLASTSVNINICKIQKATNFTYFYLKISKIFHIRPSKIVYIVYTIILLISHFAPFFLSLLLIIFFLRYTQTQTHPHTNTNTQTNQHWDRSALAAEIGGCGSTESVLVGFDSCGAGGFLFLWFLWWRWVLVVDKLFDHERKRKKKMLVEGGDLTVRKGRRRSLPWKGEESRRSQKDKDWSEWEMR